MMFLYLKGVKYNQHTYDPKVNLLPEGHFFASFYVVCKAC